MAILREKTFTKLAKKITANKDILVVIAGKFDNKNIAKLPTANSKHCMPARPATTDTQSAPKPAMPYAGLFAAIASSNFIDAKCAVVNPPKRTTMTTPNHSKSVGYAEFITT